MIAVIIGIGLFLLGCWCGYEIESKRHNNFLERHLENNLNKKVPLQRD